MKVDSYQVGFGVSQQNLGFNLKRVDVLETKTNMENDKATTVKKTQSVKKNQHSIDAELSMKLQAGMLESLQSRNRTRAYQAVKAEYEELNFKTKAIVKAEGKEITVDLQANLKRSFVVNEKIILDQIIFTDPLVISLNGGMPQLGKTSFEFDIDSDGQSDQISTLRHGSGFLALDKNGNGKIDNGNELFGTKSGDGFRDLKAYDDDKNGWIDENDKIFDKLRIWQKTDSGDKLVGIGEVGIGAIFLGNANTDFTYKSLEENETQGRLRSSGFFLFENGRAGVISQIDLRKFKKADDDNKMENAIQNMLKQSQDKSKKASGFDIYSNQSKELSSKGPSSHKSPVDKLREKIMQLQAKLSQAQGKDVAKIQNQIMGLNEQILTLMRMGIS